MNNIKIFIKSLVPPIILDIKRRLMRQYPPVKKERVRFSGNYTTWQEALLGCTGYGSDEIMEKVKASAIEVKEGRAAYERDSMLFFQEEYNWPLIAIMQKIAYQNAGKLSVLDFGGSLGSTYFQNKKMLADINLSWNIVEQPHFVKFGKKELEDSCLRFHAKTSQSPTPDIVLLSGVLPYLEEPYRNLHDICELQVKNIIIDRTPFFLKGENNRLTIQNVPEYIYKASYPAWFFSLKKMLDILNQYGYNKVCEFDVSVDSPIQLKYPDETAFYKGIWLKHSQL